MRKVFLVLGLTLFSGSSAWAIPQTLNFQGYLKESGSPVTGTRDMTFSLYAAPSGGSSLFSEAHTGASAVTVSTGVFNATIGDLTSGGIPLNLFDGSDRYVEVAVGATTLPRQKITSVGNAFFAATAATLTPGAQISSAVFTATGSTQYSLQTSSGINVQNGGVTAPFFSGTFVGNGAGLTGLTGTDSSKVARTGDTMTGQLTLSGSTLTVTGNAFSVGGTTFSVSGSSVGIRTTSPQAALDVNGNAQFGNGATKSTFTTTGALNLAANATLNLSGASGNIATQSSVTASAFFGDGSHLINVPSTLGSLPTRQVFTTSGSGTYYTPANVRQLRIRMVGGGGGGGGQGASCTPSGNGGITSFNSIVSTGGGRGLDNLNAYAQGGIGGTGGTGTASFRIGGGGGDTGGVGVSADCGGLGGNSALGGGAAARAYNAATNGFAGGVNSGGGGSGGEVVGYCGGGGGGGEYAEIIISNPAGTYSYTVGNGGAGGVCANANGGAGGSGIIIVDEFY